MGAGSAVGVVGVGVVTAELVDASPVRLGAQVPEWPVPAAAVVEWLNLQAAVLQLEGRPVCARDPEAWFASGASGASLVAEAVAACGWCPVRVECLAYAVAAVERQGVWGGSTPEERRVLAGRSR